MKLEVILISILNIIITIGVLLCIGLMISGVILSYEIN